MFCRRRWRGSGVIGRIRSEESPRCTVKNTMKKFWEFTFAGAAIGLIMGGLLSLVSGNVFVVIMVGIVVTVVGRSSESFTGTTNERDEIASL